MNMFILDENTDLSVQYHVDKHVVKMITEHTQLLSSAYYFTGEEHLACYKLSHPKHPCAIWARQNLTNWLWLQQYTIKLYGEYEYRYGGFHIAGEKCLRLQPPNLPAGELTPFAQAMPLKYMCPDAVTAYRNYYIGEKMHLLKYTRRPIPYWIPEQYHNN